MASAPQATLATLQAGRGVAALAVVFFHAQQSLFAFGAPPPAPVAALLAQGYLGVDFFFVLSGFIIDHTNRNGAGRPGWSRRYAARRLTRIYVPYLPVGIGMAAAYVLLPGLSRGGRAWDWPATVTLLPAGSPALAAAWTLQHELLFYALAWLLLRTGRVLEGAAVWALLIAGWNLLFWSAAGIPLALINLEFLFGMAVAWLFSCGSLPAARWLVPPGIALCAAFFLLFAKQPLSVVFGFGLAFLVAALVQLEGAGRVAVPAPLTGLGDVSYALYLVHLPVQALLVRAMPGAALGWAAALALLVLASLACGLAYHRLFERPALAFARRHLHGA